jgi:hypothetical protein
MPSIIIASNIVLSGDEAALSLDHPIIGWSTATSAAADSEDSNNPASNMQNPATHLFWRAGAPDSPPATYIYITLAGYNDNFDYVAIARHNLGTNSTPIAIGYFDSNSPFSFIPLIGDTILPDDGPTLFRFAEQGTNHIVIRLTPGGFTPQIAVAYGGKLLVLPRKVYQGFAPINHSRVAKVTNGRSEAGNFLGRIVLQEFVKDTMPLSLIDPTYFRDHITQFLTASKESPFFIAWRPQTYPTEVGYCHMTNDPVPINEAPHGLIGMQLEMTGII